ncbi:MAG: hypothetical protein ACTSO2_13710 [Promethearchaeota archaeon]
MQIEINENEEKNEENTNPLCILFNKTLERLNIDKEIFYMKNNNQYFELCLDEIETFLDETDIKNFLRQFIHLFKLPNKVKCKLRVTQRREIASEFLIDYINTKGKFIVDEKRKYDNEGIYYVYDCKVISIYTDEFQRMLIPFVDKKENLLNRIIANSDNYPIVKIFKYFHYNQDDNEIYFTDFRSGYYIITENHVFHYFNGENDIYFIYTNEEDYINIDFEDIENKDLTEFFNKFNFEENFLKKMDYVNVLYAYTLSVVFDSIINAKPILMIRGQQGSGKTTLSRELLRFLIGSKAQAIRLDYSKTDELDVILSNYKYILLDNVEYINKAIQDAMAIASTNGIKIKRKLYTTNQTIEFNYSCFIIATAINPRLRRSDIVDRMILINLKRFKEFIPDEDIMLTKETLNEYYASFFNTLMKMLKILKEGNIPEYYKKYRLSSFYRIFSVALLSLDIEDIDIEEILDSVDKTLQDYLFEEDELIDLICDILDGKIIVPNALGGHTTLSFTNNMTSKKLREILIEAGLNRDKYTARKIIMTLTNMKDNLDKIGIVFEKKIVRSNKRVYNIYKK